MPSPSPIPGLALTAALLAWGVAPSRLTGRLGAAMKDDGISLADLERRDRGYYEGLLDAGARPAEPEAASPAKHEAFASEALVDPVADLREFVLKPRLQTAHRGAPWSTNALGMRDRDYDVNKPPKTLRIALLGDSIGAGWGVDDDSGFEPTLERSLDARSRSNGGPRVEIWNFSVPGHAPGQRFEDFRRIGANTNPDFLIYEATPADLGWDERRLRGLLPRGIGADAPQYRDILKQSGVSPGTDAESCRRALRPLRPAILSGVYRAIADDCRTRAIPSLWVLVPRVGRPASEDEKSALIGAAKSAGFSAILDLSGLFDGIPASDLAISSDDFHPNALGHARIAGAIEASIVARPNLLPIGGLSR